MALHHVKQYEEMMAQKQNCDEEEFVLLSEELWLCKCSLKKYIIFHISGRVKKPKPYLIFSRGRDYNFSSHNLDTLCKKGD